jgi:alkylhydroperoxidase family enzyme
VRQVTGRQLRNSHGLDERSIDRAVAAKHYDEDQLGALVSLIAVINTYNRINVIIRQPAGDYQPGQWD